MTQRLTATQASRAFSEILNRVRYEGESFIVTRGDDPVAEIRPLPAAGASRTVSELVSLLIASRMPDEHMAEDLEAVQGAQGLTPEDPWAS